MPSVNSYIFFEFSDGDGWLRRLCTDKRTVPGTPQLTEYYFVFPDGEEFWVDKRKNYILKNPAKVDPEFLAE